MLSFWLGMCMLGVVSGALDFEYKNAFGPFILRWGFFESDGAEHIDMEITMPGRAYQGIGFADTFGRGSDVVMGWLDPATNRPVLGDYWHFSSQAPMDDRQLNGTNDVTVISGSNDPATGLLSLRFSRALVTNDPNDVDLEKGPTALDYAWCTADFFCSNTPGDLKPHPTNTVNFVFVDLSGKHATRI